MTDVAEVAEVEKIRCTECGGSARNHDVVKKFDVQDDDPESGVTAGGTYKICRCRGCGSVRFYQETWCSEEWDPETGEPLYEVKTFPEVDPRRRQGINVMPLPVKVSHIYAETLTAHNAGASVLAGAGLRTIVEAICIDQKASGQTLEKKIDDLVAKQLLAKPQADLLHEERYIGNYALHELSPPSKKELDDGFTIVEGLLNTIYILPESSRRLKTSREQRAKKK